MMTGLHTGTIPFDISLTELAPPLEPGWEDVVEVDFEPEDTEVVLSTFDHSETIVLPELGTYRARYCATGMDQARDQDTRHDGEEVTDRYLLALWPAPPAGENVVRQTSEQAAYWAQVAQETPAPVVLSEVEQAALEQAAAELADREGRRQDKQRRSLMEARHWRGVEPTPEMRGVGPAIAGVAEHDYALAQLIAQATNEVRRRIAEWAALEICERAHDAALDWTPALDALTRGEPLPPPFDDSGQVFGLLYSSSSRKTATIVVSVDRGGARPHGHVPIDPPAAAAATLAATQNPDAVIAAITALRQAAVRHARPG